MLPAAACRLLSEASLPQQRRSLFAYIPPHLAPGVRRCSAISLRLEEEFVFLGRPPLCFVANNETSQQASARI
jgi:hypothetical protein